MAEYRITYECEGENYNTTLELFHPDNARPCDEVIQTCVVEAIAAHKKSLNIHDKQSRIRSVLIVYDQGNIVPFFFEP